MTLPIRVRLTVVYVIGAAIVQLALGAFVYALVRHDLTASIDLGLRSRAQTLVDGVARGDLSVAAGGGALIDSDEALNQVIDPGDAAVPASVVATSPAATGLPPLLDSGQLASLTGPLFVEKVVPQVDTDPLRLLAVPATGSGGRPLAVVVGATLGDRQDAMHVLLVALGAGTPVAIALTAVAAWFVAGRGLRPVERLRREAAAISASDLGHRLAVPATRDEIARLADTLNGLLDRVQTSVDRQARFVDDASHELRTPLSILKMELDLALARDRGAEELRAALRSAAGETDRLIALAADLLVLARLNGGQLPVHREPVDLAALLATVDATYQPRARERGVRLAMAGPPVPVSVDPVRIRQAVENLLDNAIRATPAGGTVTVEAVECPEGVRIVAEDTGPGFPDSIRGREFEPFTRADPAADDGAGLGLAIVLAVVTAHQGTVEARNLPGGGARVTITLPGAVLPGATQPATAT